MRPNEQPNRMWSAHFRELLNRTFEQWQRRFPLNWRLLPYALAASKDPLTAVGVALILLCYTTVSAETLRVRVLDAHNGRPITGEEVNVHVKDVRGDVTYKTDATGTFAFDVRRDAELSVATEWRITCLDKRSKAQVLFSAEEILRSGVIEPNTCGKAKTELIPGTITIFTRKATIFENMAR